MLGSKTGRVKQNFDQYLILQCFRFNIDLSLFSGVMDGIVKQVFSALMQECLSGRINSTMDITSFSK
jgi:hypothetical protein